MPSSSLQGLRKLHGLACKRRFSTFYDLLLTETPQSKSSSREVDRIYLNTMSLFSFDVDAEIENLTARTKVRAKCVLRAVTKHLTLKEDQCHPAPVAQSRLPLLTSKSSRRSGVPARTPSSLHFTLASTPPLRTKKEHPSSTAATGSLFSCCSL